MKQYYGDIYYMAYINKFSGIREDNLQLYQ